MEGQPKVLPDWEGLVVLGCKGLKVLGVRSDRTDMLTTIKVTEPLSLTIAFRGMGREQLAYLSTVAARSGRCAFMSAASGWGAGDKQGAKIFLEHWHRGRGLQGGDLLAGVGDFCWRGAGIRPFLSPVVLLSSHHLPACFVELAGITHYRCK